MQFMLLLVSAILDIQIEDRVIRYEATSADNFVRPSVRFNWHEPWIFFLRGGRGVIYALPQSPPPPVSQNIFIYQHACMYVCMYELLILFSL